MPRSISAGARASNSPPAALICETDLGERGGRDVRIIRHVGQAARERGVGVFEIGEPHAHQSGKLCDRLHALVAAGVVDDRDLEAAPARRADRGGQQMGVMGRRHQVDVEGALILQLEHDLNQALRSDLDTEAAGRDLVVLAVDALERAAD